MEKPTTDHLKALGYKLTQSVAKGVHVRHAPRRATHPQQLLD